MAHNAVSQEVGRCSTTGGSQGMYITFPSAMRIRQPILALKPRGDATRNPKQWPQNRTCECVPPKKRGNFEKKRRKKASHLQFLFLISRVVPFRWRYPAAPPPTPSPPGVSLGAPLFYLTALFSFCNQIHVYIVVRNITSRVWKYSCTVKFPSHLNACTTRIMPHLFSFFFLKFLADTCPFLGPLVPLFWISSDVSSGFQSQSGFCLIHYFCRGECNVHSPSFTSGATLADLLAAGTQLVTSPHACAEVGLGSDWNVQPHEHKTNALPLCQRPGCIMPHLAFASSFVWRASYLLYSHPWMQGNLLSVALGLW